MLTNADCTFYELNNFKRHVVCGVFWADSRGLNLGKGGFSASDGVLIYIYSSNYIPKVGDIAVRGKVSFSFDTTSEKTISESMKQFREQFSDYIAVKSVKNARYGGLPHIEVNGV